MPNCVRWESSAELGLRQGNSIMIIIIIIMEVMIMIVINMTIMIIIIMLIMTTMVKMAVMLWLFCSFQLSPQPQPDHNSDDGDIPWALNFWQNWICTTWISVLVKGSNSDVGRYDGNGDDDYDHNDAWWSSWSCQRFQIQIQGWKYLLCYMHLWCHFSLMISISSHCGLTG